jgi:hypothetical protein
MTSPKSPKGGRPAKGGGPDAVPVNLRLAPADHEALVNVASEIREPGRPVPTVQDVLRRLVRGSLTEPETLRRLVDLGKV